MIIIDSQVHIWERPRPPDGAPGVHRAEPLGKDELLREMDAAGVHRTIVVPPSWEGNHNDVTLEAARLHPGRFAVMGRFPIEQPAKRGLLAAWKNQPGMLGIRLTFHRGAHPSWLADGTADWFWEAAERYSIPVMVFAPHTARKFGEIAARHPSLRLVIDHMGLSTDLRGTALGPAIEDLLELARYANVAVKASGLPCYVTEPYPFPRLHPHIRRVVETFGPRRVFWGSDLSRLPCPYRQALALFTEELDCLSAIDKEWIMGRGIAEWLNWSLPPLGY